MAELVDAQVSGVIPNGKNGYLKLQVQILVLTIFNHFKTNTMNEEAETETAVEFLFRMYMDNKQKLTLADFINAYDIETEQLIQASEQNYQSEN